MKTDLDLKLDAQYARIAAKYGVCPVYVEALIDPDGRRRKRDMYDAYYRRKLMEAQNEEASN